MSYFKVLDHDDSEYELGLNQNKSGDIILHEDSDEPDLNQNKSGEVFCCKKRDVPFFIKHVFSIDVGQKLAFISIPEDVKVVHYANGITANKIVIKKIIDLKDWDAWGDEKFCLEAAKKNGACLKYIKKQTHEICLAAVKQNSWASMEYVKKQTPEICLAAVKQNGHALAFVKKQTPEICLAAVRQNGFAFGAVKNQTLELCLEAVKENKAVLLFSTMKKWKDKIPR